MTEDTWPLARPTSCKPPGKAQRHFPDVRGSPNIPKNMQYLCLETQDKDVALPLLQLGTEEGEDHEKL